MRLFSYFLFENFDADHEASNPLNPRRLLNSRADELLSTIASFPAGSCAAEKCQALFGSDLINSLIAAGAIRNECGFLLFDTPVFLQEDASALSSALPIAADRIADQLEACLPLLRRLCGGIQNGFSTERNLYHILCGMVFDGSFFDFLERNRAVSVSRIHTSGLNYLSIIYEKCSALDTYSDNLLCSYNRAFAPGCVLQSFGDANGTRHDFYRFFRHFEAGSLPEQYRAAQTILQKYGAGGKAGILKDISDFILHNERSASAQALLEEFGYASDGRICVPVYTGADENVISEISRAVETHVGSIFIEELTRSSKTLPITANLHGVSPKETANELYHILFGCVNEALVKRGIVSAPPYRPGEGRYLKSILIQ